MVTKHSVPHAIPNSICLHTSISPATIEINRYVTVITVASAKIKNDLLHVHTKCTVLKMKTTVTSITVF